MTWKLILTQVNTSDYSFIITINIAIIIIESMKAIGIIDIILISVVRIFTIDVFIVIVILIVITIHMM